MARGGRRTGTPGTAYPNRTDLPGKPLAPTAMPNQPYGAAGAQLSSQQAVPMASPPAPSAAAPTPGGAAPPAAGGVGAPMPSPGAAGDLHRPTERPGEPVQAGMAMGPGPGPEAIPGYGGGQSGGPGASMADIIGSAASVSGSPVLGRMADMAKAMGQ